jgi:RecA-family ATPase
MPDVRTTRLIDAQRALDRDVEKRVRLNGHAFEPSAQGDGPVALDLVALAGADPQPPKFIIDQWLPQAEVSLLGAHGGIGKSLIGLQLAVAVASGRHFFGLEVQRRKTAFLSYEDSTAVLSWRMHRICAWMGLAMDSLSDDLAVLDGSRSVGVWFGAYRGESGLTKHFFEISERLAGAEVIVVDGASDTFAGNENDRGQVKQFIRALRRLVPENGALLLLAHVDKQTAKLNAASEGYSGSTGWHNGPRARWYVRRQGEDESDQGGLVLELQKSNLGRSGAQIKLHWDPQSHVFDGSAVAASGFDRKHQSRVELDGIRAAFLAAEAGKNSVPAAMQGQRTAYMVLSTYPQFPESLKGKSASKIGRFREAIEVLRRIQHIKEDGIRRSNRHFTLAFVLTPEGRAACAEFHE